MLYDGVDQTWKPTVLDADGNELASNSDYAVTYDKVDRTNVTGAITDTITGLGNYSRTSRVPTRLSRARYEFKPARTDDQGKRENETWTGEVVTVATGDTRTFSSHEELAALRG